jgi:hypothetical protein
MSYQPHDEERDGPYLRYGKRCVTTTNKGADTLVHLTGDHETPTGSRFTLCGRPWVAVITFSIFDTCGICTIKAKKGKP